MPTFEYDQTLDIAVQTPQKNGRINCALLSVISSAKKSLQMTREE